MSVTHDTSLVQKHRPTSPSPSCVSERSNVSMDPPYNFTTEETLTDEMIPQGRQPSPPPSCVSMKSDVSMDPPYNFVEGVPWPSGLSKAKWAGSESQSICLSLKSDVSMDPPYNMKGNTQHSTQWEHLENVISDRSPKNSNQSDLSSVFQLLEDNIVTFMKWELKRFKGVLDPNLSQSKMEKESSTKEEAACDSSATEGALKITLHILRTTMNQKELADKLETTECEKALGCSLTEEEIKLHLQIPKKSGSLADCLSELIKRHHIAISYLGKLAVCQRKLKSNLKRRFQCVFEGIPNQGNPTLLNKIYTELYITEGGSGEVNSEHEVRQIETASRKSARLEAQIKCSDIFEPLPGQDKIIRSVITKGVAGIGKTVAVQKFALDWAEGVTNRKIQLIILLPFRELNLLKKKQYSLMDLLHHFFVETKESGISCLEEYNIVFIFDGLDECRLPLDFQNNETCSDVTVATSLDVLLTNLISGNLLPSARLWITSRPAAANRIPPEYIDQVTEIRGFSDPQKEEYFSKRISDKDLACRIITHLKSSRSLYIMCHIPVFSWISATVLEKMLGETESGEEMPTTLTQMYTHFLSCNMQIKHQKYSGMNHGARTSDSQSRMESDREMIMKLGNLAYEQLQQGNLIFYEDDLEACGIDVEEASVYSGVCTQIFKEEFGLCPGKVFCFVHLSIQEFLAALYVFCTFINANINLMTQDETTEEKTHVYEDTPAAVLYKNAVDRALESENGHLDLFLRFLLGLSVDTNQTPLRGLLIKAENTSQTNRETAEYIKEKIKESPAPERCVNLFHCLNELRDHSLVEEIQQYLSSGRLSNEKLSPAQWSALVFVLLTSEKELEVFDLQQFSRSEEGLLRLLPVVKASRKVLLKGCNLTENCCAALASALSSKSSELRELDLSDNDLQDSGVKLLATGLGSPSCKLEILKLSFCGVTEQGCASLAVALKSNPSHLRELDISYNHPGNKGVMLISSAMEHPLSQFQKLSVDHDAECWLKSGLKKYACEVTLNPNTAHRHLLLSEGDRKVTWVEEEQPYPDNPERFDHWSQVLCREGLSGRCYWEAEWSGPEAHIGMTYEGIGRKGEGYDCGLRYNDKSWSLRCASSTFVAYHSSSSIALSAPFTPSHRVGVYLDWPAGTLSFYSVSSGTLTHLHTFHSKFTEPLIPGFRLWNHDTSVRVCQ